MHYLPSHTADLCGEQSKTEVAVQLNVLLQHSSQFPFVLVPIQTLYISRMAFGRDIVCAMEESHKGLELHECEKIMAEYSFLRALNNHFDCQ